MENKQGSGARAGSLGGKGFYIVLLLCAAVIGISAWIMLTKAGTNVENETAEDVVAETTAGTEPDPAVETAAEPETQQTAADGTARYVWPVQGDVARPYSIQRLLYDSTMADWRTHDGVDLACEQGTPVAAVAGGLVVGVYNDDLLGTVVEIDHENGMHSVYANLAAQPPVSPGEYVTMGQTVGSVGATALGEVNQVSHLHFAMTEDGISADPTAYLPSDWTE